MIRLLGIVLISILPSQDASPGTVLLRDGTRMTGAVADRGTEVVVKTGGQTFTYPASEVLEVYAHESELFARCRQRLDEAKKLYEEAQKLNYTVPAHNQKLRMSVLLLEHLRRIYDILSRDSGRDVADPVRNIMQLLRMVRSSMGSERSSNDTTPLPDKIPLAEPGYAFEPPPLEKGGAGGTLDGEIGPGVPDLLERLKAKKGKDREKTVRSLGSPPSPTAVPALVTVLFDEENRNVLRAIGDALRHFPADDLIGNMKWLRNEKNRDRIEAGFRILRGRPGPKTREFVLDLWVDGSPDASRGWVCSFLREHRAWAVPELEKRLKRERDRKKQSRIVMMLGAIGDAAAAKTLVAALGALPVEAFTGLENLGEPAVYGLVKYGFGGSPQAKAYALYLLRQITGVPRSGAAHFQTWYKENREEIEANEEEYWVKQEEDLYPVDDEVWNGYKRKPGDLTSGDGGRWGRGRGRRGR